MCRIPFVPTAGRYNLTISHDMNFIWFRVAKVGTRSILNHLKESKVNLDVEHASFIRYPTILFDNYFKFAFVRNPWGRLVSCWKDKVINNNYFHLNGTEREKMKEFKNFITYVEDLDIDKCDHHIRSQSSLINLNHINYLGRMESFENDTNYVFQKLRDK